MMIVNRPLRAMHIISGDLWAGAEMQVYTLLKQLMDEVELHVVVLNPGELVNRLMQLGVKVSVVPENNLTFWQIVKQTLALANNFKPNVIHSHRKKEHFIAAILLLARRCNGCQCINVRTIHGSQEFKLSVKQKIFAAMEVWLGRVVQAAIIAVSEELKLKLDSVFGPSRVFLIKNGVDFSRLANAEPAADIFNSQIARHVAIVGRLEPVKRVDIFLAMAKLLVADGLADSWHFHIFGSGGLSSDLVAICRNLNLESQVTFHGNKAEMAGYLKAMDVVVMCSDHEGTPMVALEAMAAGCILIAHQVGGLAELLRDYPDLLVKDHSAEGYGQALTRILAKNLPRNSFVLPLEYHADVNACAVRELYAAMLDPKNCSAK